MKFSDITIEIQEDGRIRLEGLTGRPGDKFIGRAALVDPAPASSPEAFIPYGRPAVDEKDILAVAETLTSAWLTTGPKVAEFEQAFAAACGADHATACSSGTAALHAIMNAIGIGPGDEVIVPALTFVATANAVVFQGGWPIFADVDPETLLIDPKSVEEKITPRTKAIVAVDYAGQPCDYDALKKIAADHGLFLIDDACHAWGAAYKGRLTGGLGDLTAFSFHPVKHLTTGEGGMATTKNAQLAKKMKIFRHHGLSSEPAQRLEQGTWYSEMQDLGYNYRLSDVACALGLSQLSKQPVWLARRRAIAQVYHRAWDNHPLIRPLAVRPEVDHSYHLFVVQFETGRDRIFTALREAGLGVTVHYPPVHLNPFYRRSYGTGEGLCPVVEAAYRKIMTLPLFPTMTDEQVERVVTTVNEVVRGPGFPGR
ncbi:MAG: UDP-4-amino-4,6-dideoxy-N-acetyl-beta-L-altrosamine transaminase [Deltaproteobacteria bacterium]|nr:UDP-4-amino-4,6-dideoxy-N-acetyl-beta-L-altrosamine transaminase [Deltaproteobacteria bacterium]